MLTLSKLKYDLKGFTKILGLILGFLLLLFVLLKVAIFVKEIIRPTPPAPASAKFGKISQILFPESVTEEKLTYEVDTLSGNLPSFSHLADVYRMRQPQADLLALDRANTKAGRIGFTGKGKKISENMYEWVKSSSKKTLRMDIKSLDFIIRSDFSSTSARFTNPESEFEAIGLAQGTLEAMDLLHEDIDTEKTFTVFYSVRNGSLIEASSLANAQAIGVFFQQKDVGELPLYYPNSTSNMRLIVAFDDDRLEIKYADFSYQSPDLKDKTNYTIKNTQEAFDELKNNKGYIAKYVPQEKHILIKNIYLGYYIGEKKQEYLLPIYVFEGNNFLAYVSAVRDEWIKN